MCVKKRLFKVVYLLCFLLIFWFVEFLHINEDFASQIQPPSQLEGYAGSESCRECHEKSYQLLTTSFHGLAMQKYTPDFAQNCLTPLTNDITINKYQYHVEITGKTGWVYECGPKTTRKYRIEYILGGKNVYYFLTSLEKGRLQTLPLAYDVHKREWFDTSASGVRHFPGARPGEPINWKEASYTFNTACYSCHVSQLFINYDSKTETYQTIWGELGINCETCHGPSEGHVRVCKATPKGKIPEDLKIILTKKFNIEQRDALCAPCHAKMIPLTTNYIPGEQFFDHYDLVSLEDPDFYPDGRDLGENFTYTSWLMNPCIKSGKLSCLHCHNFDGRYRFTEEAKSNDACMPCHENLVNNSASHSHHKTDSPGNKCVSCHMPMTEFARMRRSDHSMLPPTPETTIAFQSPNACNLCHTEETAIWADKYVREWYKRDYQTPILHRARLIDAARKRDWRFLGEMLSSIESKDCNEMYAAALLRLLRTCEDQSKYPVIRKALKDPSPLVRSAASELLGFMPAEENYQALIVAIEDNVRLVRIRAAAALASYPEAFLSNNDKAKIEKATSEYLAFLTSKPDQWTSHYNLGNYYLNRGDLVQAQNSFETALRLEPRATLALVNASIVYAQMSDNAKALKSLQKALKISPENATANFNMGLLKAELQDFNMAEKYLRAALKTDPQLAEAAYNLSILLSKDRLSEAVEWCKKAFELRPNPRYGYTLAYYVYQKKETDQAIKILQQMLQKWPAYGDAYLLLGEIYQNQGNAKKASSVYLEALNKERLSEQERYRLEFQYKSLLRSKQKEGK